MSARFDVEPLKTRTNLVLGVDNEMYAQSLEDARLSRFITALRKAKVFGIDGGHQQDMTFLTMRSSSLERFEDAPGAAVVVLDTLYNMGDPDVTLPSVRMSHEILDTAGGRRGMQVSVRWPQTDEKLAARFATKQMQQFASNVDLNGGSRLNRADDMVYMEARREHGIKIETNPLGSCNISAGGYDYDSTLEIVELWQHNIYSPKQQLACLVGAVSFATADLHIDS